MRKLGLAVLSAVISQFAHGAVTQRVVEAEAFASGTTTADMLASAGSAVSRSSTGTYAWWVTNTADLSTGTYSVYARVALAPGVTGPKSFGPQIYYGGNLVTTASAGITNKAFRWIRITSFDLAQIGGELRIADWSEAGLLVDKLAIVKDVAVQAELVSGAGATIVTETAAQGGRAITRSTSGIYQYWIAPQTDLAPGDYDVLVRLKSASGTRTFTGIVALDDVNELAAAVPVSSTSYQWIKANSFTNAGGQQKVTIADHSDPGLIVDAVRLVRRTPYDRQSAAQALFAAGSVALGPAEEVVFNGVNTGLPRLQNPGRVSIVQVNATTVYAYYRQEIASEKFQIYMATSTDGGKTFTVRPDPVIRLQSVAGFTEPLQTAYDQQVTKRPDGYYMVFEGAGLGCEFSAMSAFSPDGINNWQVRNVSVCDKMGQEGSASVPTYYVDVETGTEYLQWVSPNYIQQITRSYQTSLPTGLFKGQLTFTADAQMAPYALPQSPPGSWDAPLFGTTGVYYEDGYYYASHNLANRYNCDGRWAIGVARTATPGTVSSWKKSLKNPLLLAGDVGTCWMEYPSIVMLPSGLYLYYYDGYTNYLPDNRNNRSIFRRKLLPN